MSRDLELGGLGGYKGHPEGGKGWQGVQESRDISIKKMIQLKQQSLWKRLELIMFLFSFFLLKFFLFF